MHVVSSYSGGKDCSTATILHLALGHKVTCVSYIPEFGFGIPLINKAQYEYMLRARDYLCSLGCDFHFVRGISYYDWCMRRLTKGNNVGLVQGFPCFLRGKCGFMKDSKKASVESFIQSVMDYDTIDIGYTIDEDRGSLDALHSSILIDLGYTQKDTFEFVKKYNNGKMFIISKKLHNQICVVQFFL